MKYAFLTEVAPLESGGHANHSIAWSWIQAMQGHTGVVITRRFHRSIQPKKVRGSLGMPVLFAPDFSLLGLRRISTALRCFLDNLLFALSLPWLVRAIRRTGCTRIFAFPSGWWQSMIDAWLLGWATGLPVDLFLVDDFEAQAVMEHRVRDARMAQWASRWFLPRFARIYTLSKGHAEHLQQKFGVHPEWLPLVIRAQQITDAPPPAPGEIRYIGFSGSMNELYREALVELNQVIVQLNQTTPHRYRMALCVLGHPYNLGEILPDTSVIDVFESLPNAQLVERLRLNYANFLPYSFSDSLRIMVSTAFSCKSSEYFAAGRPILVYGPDYASVPRHFLENHLPLVSTTKGSLEELISQIEQFDKPDLIARYREVVEQFHSPAALRRHLLPPDGVPPEKSTPLG